jgi:hypothetical protein
MGFLVTLEMTSRIHPISDLSEGAVKNYIT